ncbi:MAG TPA: hypothetical protein VHB99_09660 [Pirellulales bacterium]|nr:hypothetical protein [Pirellulales bacterium]
MAEMSQQFPDRFPQSLDRVPPRILQTRETPEGRKEYFEWLAQNARFFLLSKESHAPRDRRRSMPDSAYANQLRAQRAELLPPGRYRFDCGDRARPTEHQKVLFDRMEGGQTQVFQEVAKALREFYLLCRGHCGEPIDLYDQILFPGGGSEDVSLDCFRIQSFLLHPSAEQIGLTFDSLFDWCEEHGCAVLVSDGKVGEYGWGGSDVLFDLYDELSQEADQDE